MLEHETECGIKFSMKNYVNDIPAVAYVKQINFFSSKLNPCSICPVNAVYSEQSKCQIFNPPAIHPPWKHEDFVNQKCANQKAKSPIIKLQKYMDLILDIPPDPMHVLFRYYVIYKILKILKPLNLNFNAL